MLLIFGERGPDAFGYQAGGGGGAVAVEGCVEVAPLKLCPDATAVFGGVEARFDLGPPALEVPEPGVEIGGERRLQTLAERLGEGRTSAAGADGYPNAAYRDLAHVREIRACRIVSHVDQRADGPRVRRDAGVEGRIVGRGEDERRAFQQFGPVIRSEEANIAGPGQLSNSERGP